jgi:hypothetical protein
VSFLALTIAYLFNKPKLYITLPVSIWSSSVYLCLVGSSFWYLSYGGLCKEAPMLPPLRVLGCSSHDQYQLWFLHPGHLLPGVLPVDHHIPINSLHSSPSCLHLLRMSSLASPGYHPAHSLPSSFSSLYPVGSFFVFIQSGLPCQLFLLEKMFSFTFVWASSIRSYMLRVGGGSSPCHSQLVVVA